MLQPYKGLQALQAPARPWSAAVLMSAAKIATLTYSSCTCRGSSHWSSSGVSQKSSRSNRTKTAGLTRNPLSDMLAGLPRQFRDRGACWVAKRLGSVVPIHTLSKNGLV